jgi:hypothetical protein
MRTVIIKTHLTYTLSSLKCSLDSEVFRDEEYATITNGQLLITLLNRSVW